MQVNLSTYLQSTSNVELILSKSKTKSDLLYNNSTLPKYNITQTKGTIRKTFTHFKNKKQRTFEEFKKSHFGRFILSAFFIYFKMNQSCRRVVAVSKRSMSVGFILVFIFLLLIITFFYFFLSTIYSLILFIYYLSGLQCAEIQKA